MKATRALFGSTATSGADWGPPGDASSLYRYRLWRRWGPGPLVCFIMLNPSVANELENDPTVRRCIGFARAWGFGGLAVVNLFGYRATDPAELVRVMRQPNGYAHAVGPGNDGAIEFSVQACDRVVAAWGTLGELGTRSAGVIRNLRVLGRYVHALKLSKDGHPCHPLYLRADLRPFVWITARP